MRLLIISSIVGGLGALFEQWCGVTYLRIYFLVLHVFQFLLLPLRNGKYSHCHLTFFFIVELSRWASIILCHLIVFRRRMWRLVDRLMHFGNDEQVGRDPIEDELDV